MKSCPAQGKKLFMKWHMHRCMARTAVNLEENMVVRLSGEHNYDYDTDITVGNPMRK